MDPEATILIVDDEPTNVDMLTQELDEEGVSCFCLKRMSRQCKTKVFALREEIYYGCEHDEGRGEAIA